MVRREDWAEPSLAARREARRLGIAMAAMMPIIATTIRSSINEKPSWRLLVMVIRAPFTYLSLLVAQRGHRCTNDQSSGVGNRGQGVVAVHHADLSDTEATSTGLRNTARGCWESISAEHCGRAGAGLFDDREVVAALAATRKH